MSHAPAELPGWSWVMRAFGFGAARGGAERMRPLCKERRTAIVRATEPGFTMKLDRVEWAQYSTWFLGRYAELAVQCPSTSRCARAT